jgi:hypothetical protein
MSASSCSREDDILERYKVGRMTVYRLNQVIKAEKTIRKIDGCADDNIRGSQPRGQLYVIPYGGFEGEPVWTGSAFDRRVCGHY